MTASQEPTTRDRINALATWIQVNDGSREAIRRGLELCNDLARVIAHAEAKVKVLEERLKRVTRRETFGSGGQGSVLQ